MTKSTPLLMVLLCAVSMFGSTKSFASPVEVFSFISKPANNATNTEAVKLKITANVVTGATRYTIELSTAPDFSGSTIVMTSAIDNQRTLAFSNLAYSTKYYAHATTNVSSGYGKVTSFTTKAETFTSLIEPADNTVSNDPIVIRLQAAPLTYATNYTIEVSKVPDFSSIELSVSQKIPMFLTRSCTYSTTYYARVKTDVNTTFGPVTSFSTRARASQLRLWGVTNTGGATDRGVIYSYSIDSLKFRQEFNYQPEDEYDDANMTNGLLPAPGGGFYAFTQTIQNTSTSGSSYTFKDGVWQSYHGFGFRYGTAMLALDGNIYALQNSFMNPERILRIQDFKVVHNFPKSMSQGGLVYETRLIELTDGSLCGVGMFGGLYKKGVVYKVNKDGSAFSIIHHFNYASEGSYPDGGMAEYGDYLYGTTTHGGSSTWGTVFRMKPDGSEYTVLHSFTEPEGTYSKAEVIIKNGVMYGTTYLGGTYGKGTIFKMNIDGSGFAVLHHFAGNFAHDGDGPKDALVADDSGNLYGVTIMGGASNVGTLFKIKTDGSGYQVLHEFSAATGVTPVGLVLTDDPTTASPAVARMATRASEPVQNGISFSPNPFTEQINIVSDTKLKEVSVITVQGRVIYENKNLNDHKVQLGGDLPAGVYIVKTFDGSKAKVSRIIKR